MTTLGIVTVKRFHFHEGTYYTDGGFGKYLASMIDAFDKVILLCKVRQAPPAEGFYPVGAPNLEIIETPAWPTELGSIAAQPAVFLASLKLARRADVIHARMPDWTGVTGALAARLVGTPCFHQIIGDTWSLAKTIPLTKHFGLGIPLRAALFLYDLSERLVSRGAMVFAQGKPAYDRHHAASERYLILSTAHKAADIGEVREKFKGQEFQILAVGRLQSVKNHQLLIRALAVLRRRDPRWRLRIIGEGPKRAELEELVASLGLGDAVELPGLLSHGSELWRAYDEADLFVMCSVSEGTPKVVLEAMARGCPVVAAPVGGVATAVTDEERGLLFPSDDLDALVAAIERMSSDADLRLKCQKAAIEFSASHSLEASTKSTLERVTDRWPQLRPLKRVDA